MKIGSRFHIENGGNDGNRERMEIIMKIAIKIFITVLLSIWAIAALVIEKEDTFETIICYVIALLHFLAIYFVIGVL